MFEWISYLINTIYYKAKYRTHLRLDGMQPFNIGTKIIISGEKSKIEINKLRTSSNVHISAVDGGDLSFGRNCFLNRNYYCL